MRKHMRIKSLALRFFVTVLLPIAAVCPLKASLIFTLDAPVFTGAPGTEFDIIGTLSNFDAEPVFLNTASGSLSSGDLDFDYANFFVLVPRTLNTGDLFSGPIFSVVVSQQALPGDYLGTFTIQGGIDGEAFDDLATQNFQVTVSSTPDTPEPSSFALLASVLAAFGGCAGFRRVRGR
jgi:hypothetical protein